MRNLLAIVLGTMLMVTLSVSNIALMWFSLGWTFAFSGAGPEASPGWCTGMLVGGAVGAICGGAVCGKVSDRRSTLPGTLLVLIAACLAMIGFFMGNSIESAKLPAGKGTGDLNFTEASEYAVSPPWFHLANCLVGPGFVWCGLKIIRQR